MTPPARARAVDDGNSSAKRRETNSTAAEPEPIGTGRSKGELYRLGYKDIGKTTIARILREAGCPVDQPPQDSTWKRFLQSHRDTLWACDFLTVDVQTLVGITQFYILVFICPGTREAFYLNFTDHPDGRWMERQARNLDMKFQDMEVAPRYLVSDRDTKFTKKFSEVLEAGDLEEHIRVGPCAPDLNAHCERFIKTLKVELLRKFVVTGEGHLRYLLDEFFDFYRGRDSSRELPPAQIRA